MCSRPLISVVDDDDSVRESLQGLIRSLGFAVELFASAEHFLNSEHLDDTNSLILDVRLPGISGLELQRQLTVRDCRIPVVLISAHGDGAARSLAVRNGAVDYLFKPFSEESLLNAIHGALNRTSQGNKAIAQSRETAM